ncbi:MAG: nitrous oxide reductase accessory protein NosL [Nitrospirota bacterium]|nr:nitrous oxide reductase accessory protein NosL [Nitrospirota bacterium]
MVRQPMSIPFLAVFLLFWASFAAAADKPRCVECGMMVDEASRFSARIVEGASTLHFCDIGDLLTYLKDKKRTASGAQVKDYVTGDWIEASSAYYVVAPKRFSTPMGWDIGAFRDQDKALAFGTPLDFDGMKAALK